MNVKRMYRKRVGGARRKYPARRRGKIARGRLARPTGVVWIKKKLVSSPTASGSPGLMVFRLQDIPDGATYAGLYDQYKITGVKIQFVPQETVNQLNTGGSGNYVVPSITWAAKYSPQSTASWSEADLLCRSNAKTTLFNKPVSEYVRVRPEVETEGTSIQMPFRKSMWINTHNYADEIDNTAHYGLDYFIGNGGASSQQTYFRIITTYYISFKSPRSKNV